MDSEIVLHLIAKAMKEGLEGAMHQTMCQVQGAYSMVIMTEDTLVAVRDPNGFTLVFRTTEFRLHHRIRDMCL